MIAPILGAALLVAALPGSARAAAGPTVASSTAALRTSGPPPDTTAVHPTWRWGAGPWISLLQLRDDLLAPLRYTGPALGGRLFLERATAAGEERLDLRVGAGIGFNRMGHGAAALPWGASVAVLRRVAGSTEVAASSAAARATTARNATERAATARQLLLGAVLLVQADAVYFYDWDDAHLYWMTSYAVGPALAYRLRRGGKMTSFALALPVFGVVARPPEVRYDKVDDLIFVRTWFTLPHRGARMATWPELFLVDAHLAHDLTRRARLRYDLSFRTTSLPRRAVALAHEVGVEWTIGGTR